MFLQQNVTEDLRLTLPEVIYLECEDFEQAMILSNSVIQEERQWQTYLNVLALLGLERWFTERLLSTKVHQNLSSSLKTICDFQLGVFKIGIIAVEQVLDEQVAFPQEILIQKDKLADFYIVAEVLEEQEEMIFRGSISQQKLVSLVQTRPSDCPSETDYCIALDKFDLEPNHLLFYCHFLQSEMQTSSTEVQPETASNFQNIQTNCVKISQWFKGIFDSAWQPLEALVSPELSLAFNTRCVSSEMQRGKLINLGMKLNNNRFIMLVTVTPGVDDKQRVLVQLHPTGNEQYLPPFVQLTLKSKTGKIYQEVISRSLDNYIQLNPFKGKSGKQFIIEVCWNDTRITEEFEL